uniref:ARAD1A16654p n=1 Tax=Blastobotrys adeninivorans TaxID=409370 RepID=A0A060SY02_BLAAD
MSYNNYGDKGYGNPYGNDYEMSNVNPYASEGGQYNQYQQPVGGAPYGQQGAGAPGGGSDDMMNFFREIDEIKRSLVQFDDNVDRIEALHKRSLAEVGSEEQQTDRNLQAYVEETSNLSNQLRTRIKSLESRSQRDATKKTQVDNVKKQFMSSIQRYQSKEAEYRQKYRDAAERQIRIVRPDASDAEVREAVENGESSQVFTQALMSSNRRGQARSALTEVQSRHREIEKIERTMMELNQLFHDMEILVAEQDTAVQHIDEQATQVQQDIEQGVGHTDRAVKSARAARRKKWYCLGIVVLIIIILALILGIYFGTK